MMPRSWWTSKKQLLGIGLLGLFLLTPLPAIAADLAAIQQRGRLVVGIKDNSRPLGFMDRNGQLQGFEIDIARRLAQELLGRPDALVLQPVLNQERLPSVIDGQVDLAIARMTLTPARLRIVNFSIPYYTDGTVLITRDLKLRSAPDADSATIAVLNNSKTVEIIRDRFPNATLVGVDSYQAAKAVLEQGRALAFAADVSVLTGWVQEFPEYRLLSPMLSFEPLAIALPKGKQYEPLRQRINTVLQQWQAEGWLRERATFWGLP
ncbi:transporter substrate-binding domain-containing protein [Pantanalinema rosaneae CENA516]|uniref:transporter substrate-binding domain-containing protein n=1 Tax=Pantanalinema rosaneae TaxID=1620701 RepID=UPI003D6EBCD3